MRSKVEKFIKQWNDDPNNRDKALNVVRELTLTKEEIQDNIKSLLERDGKIEEALVKGEMINAQTYKFKKNSTQLNTNMNRRRQCFKYGGTIVALAVLGLFIWWIVRKFD